MRGKGKGAGRPTELSDELCLEIRDLVLLGKKELEIAKELEIDLKTFEHWIWRNYQGFADKWLTYKHERMLKKAERNLDEFLDMDPESNPKREAVKADITKFVSETLGKKSFSKRTELTGAEGGEINLKWAGEK